MRSLGYGLTTPGFQWDSPQSWTVKAGSTPAVSESLPLEYQSRHRLAGEWLKPYARSYEDELTELLMNEYGWRSTRGGSQTDLDRPGVPQRDFTDVLTELLRVLGDTDHEGLLRLTNDYPVFSYRDSAEDGRVSLGDLLVYEDTAESTKKAHSYPEGMIDSEFDGHDVHEAMLIAGMRNIEDVEGVLRIGVTMDVLTRNSQ